MAHGPNVRAAAASRESAVSHIALRECGESKTDSQYDSSPRPHWLILRPIHIAGIGLSHVMTKK